MSEQNYEEALTALDGVNEEVWNEQLEELKGKASDLLTQLNTLCDKIAAAVNANELRGLLPDVEACLQLKPNQDDLTKLKDDLLQREAQIDARNQQIIAQAQQLMQQLQFDAVQQILNQLALEDQTEWTIKHINDRANGLLRQAQHFNLQRQTVLSSVPNALSNKEYQVVIQGITEYLNEISNVGLQDPQLQQMLDEAKAKEYASIRNKKLIKLGIAVAGVVVVLVAGVIIKSTLDANALEIAIKTAIAEGDWEAALELDSDNEDGLRLKTAAIQAALANNNWQAALEIDPNNRDGLRLKSDAAIEAALAEGDWATVLRLDPKNSLGLRLKLLAEKAAALPNTPREMLTGHTGSVYSVAFSPDGKTIASASSDKSIKLWDSETGDELKTLYGHSSYVSIVAFSPDGKTIASGSNDRTIKLWDSESGVELKTLDGYSGSVYSVAFNPDGNTIASGNGDVTLKLWDISGLTEP